ncbi:hypothetical protein BCR33DRAFT_718706 [Rhizoclosmatium globosum]|uniref:Exonuclease domain-containing protein n=1 Tax=Rhizoclosmatium globosum TaxID=329046 RepID=A0A1Y2C3D9_9FUNG|nr:hypothetical protein BCR33DRAFT_718706 [Rhizoclosmatium globosum]|eukprot:ORY41538.1 hypothetical protein BCR33DRAFT_718706 [Rhizoclosmatium globosum]
MSRSISTSDLIFNSVADDLFESFPNEPHWESIDEAKQVKQHFDYYCVFDVEATCERNDKNWINEIIEFPVVVVCSRTLATVAEFQTYVKPVLNPVLTDFCTELTGITQEQVDDAPTFKEVLQQFGTFLNTHSLSPQNMRFVTDGPWDIRNFVRNQCKLCKIPVPDYFKDYVDLRELYRCIFKKKANLQQMLSSLGMRFEGREHSGIADSRNIARIVKALIKEGWLIENSG